MIGVFAMHWGKGRRLLTWFRVQRTAHGELQCQDRVRVPVAYAIAPPVECPDVVLGCCHAREMCSSRGTIRHLGWFVGVQGLLRRV